jgi:hypothetical protein
MMMMMTSTPTPATFITQTMFIGGWVYYKFAVHYYKSKGKTNISIYRSSGWFKAMTSCYSDRMLSYYGKSQLIRTEYGTTRKGNQISYP